MVGPAGGTAALNRPASAVVQQPAGVSAARRPADLPAAAVSQHAPAAERRRHCPSEVADDPARRPTVAPTSRAAEPTAGPRRVANWEVLMSDHLGQGGRGGSGNGGEERAPAWLPHGAGQAEGSPASRPETAGKECATRQYV
jgi:hypothetical protein